MSDEVVTGLSRLLDGALRRLGDAREDEPACRLAADAWALLDGRFPAEARRFDGTLHYLTLALPNRRREHARDRGSPRAWRMALFFHWVSPRPATGSRGSRSAPRSGT